MPTTIPPLFRPRWIATGAALLLVLGMTALWRWSPLSEWATSGNLEAHVETLARSPWAVLSLGAVYILATPVMFPLTALNLALIVAIGPVAGMAYALYGSLLAGLCAYWTGLRLGQPALDRWGNAKVDKALRIVRESGVPGLVLLRIMPVAPYAVVNLVLGAGGVRGLPFVVGTVLGILPALLLMGVVGFQLRSVLQEPSAEGMAVLAAIALACVALAFWVKHRVSARLEQA
ncbi:VTT domain-containing protein [Algiphilus sp.]|uniref:TVP38/TMEM64 family protein n=1 Tax=Algiphilus sp. TaxID=1872431 RepID=UPI002A62AA42|nr:VTT domain-containing protein [Pseudomonadota bacterium]